MSGNEPSNVSNNGSSNGSSDLPSNLTGKPLPITYAAHTVWLLPEHALWWPEGQVLFIADLHLGKAATYRALGQPVPSGTTLENLRRLSELIAHYQPKQLVFLGDFLHARQARTASVLGQLQAWRESHSTLNCILVRGNHDSRAGDPPPELNISVVDEPYLVGPFAACHHPQQHPTHAVLSGHQHPAVQLQGLGRDRLRLACFVFGARSAILPAFGEFTGGFTVTPQLGVQLYAAGGDKVWQLPFSRGLIVPSTDTQRR